jgi:hypothetical protein
MEMEMEVEVEGFGGLGKDLREGAELVLEWLYAV